MAIDNNSRTIIVGLDGVPFEMIKKFSQNGIMPNTAKLISEGIFRQMHSSIPEVSSVNWSSIITGCNPGSHGIFGFMELHPGSYKMRFPNFNDLKAPPFWESWEGKSIIINVPSTYPVHPMNGVHISGFVSIDFEKSIYPQSLVPQLRKMNYRLDVDSQLAHKSMEKFAEDLHKTLEARIEAYKYLWASPDWQTFMLVFTNTDRLMHFLWDAYEDENHRYHDFFLDHFRQIDAVIGQILDQADKDDLIVMLSDHGFEKLEYDVFINYLLIQNGFLQFKQDCKPSLENICPGTKAFALDPARIYINYKDKYPAGSIKPQESEELVNQLESLFDSLEIEGKKVIRNVYRKEQIYFGPYLNDAPDLVLVGTEGFNLKASLNVEQLTAKPLFTGKHTQDTAFLIIKGLSDTTIISDVPTVSDVKKIMEFEKQN